MADLKKCELLATKLLSRQELTSSRVDVRKIKYDKNIVFDSIQNYSKITGIEIDDFIGTNGILKDGCCIRDLENNINIVLYNEECKNMERLNFTLAHEVGHIYLDHSEDGDNEEIEANCFAAQLLMPFSTVCFLKNIYKDANAFDLQNFFGVSNMAATKRLNTYNKRSTYHNNINTQKLNDMYAPFVVKFVYSKLKECNRS